jgi:hypothetical protein
MRGLDGIAEDNLNGHEVELHITTILLVSL